LLEIKVKSFHTEGTEKGGENKTQYG
jgi:hypothetical protein